MTLRCNQCHEEKPTSAFYRNRGTETGYSKLCKSCWKQSARNYTPGTRRYRTIYSKLVPVLRRMKNDSRPSVQEWYVDLLELLPEHVRSQVAP